MTNKGINNNGKGKSNSRSSARGNREAGSIRLRSGQVLHCATHKSVSSFGRNDSSFLLYGRDGQPQEQLQLQNSYGNGKGRSNSKGKGNGNGKSKDKSKSKMRGSFASLRMTDLMAMAKTSAVRAPVGMTRFLGLADYGNDDLVRSLAF